MAGATALGATFTFIAADRTAQFFGSISGISVEMPTAEVTDMTAATDKLGYSFMVPTGEMSGGTISVDFVTSNVDPQSFVRKSGILTFTSLGYSITRRVVCQSANVTGNVNDIVRGSLKFLMTDYTGT
jgi:hypothetical protein